MQKNISIWAGIIIAVVIVAVGGFFAYQYYKKPQLQTTNYQQVQNPNTQPSITQTPTPTPKPVPVTQPTGQKNYTNNQYGFSFQYPTTLATTFAQFQQQPTAVVSLKGSSNIDDKGCYKLAIGNSTEESNGLINGISFCESSGGSPGAGQLYSSYYYTTLANGNYITLEYVVHTPNGCDNYMGSASYQNCLDFFNNFNNLVLTPIENSVASLTFTNPNQISCNTKSDCPSTDSCMVEGPITANQPPKKVCVPPGQAVPL